MKYGLQQPTSRKKARTSARLTASNAPRTAAESASNVTAAAFLSHTLILLKASPIAFKSGLYPGK